MKHKLLSFILLLSALVAGTGSVWAQTTTTYTFTSKSWAATSGGSAANWTSGKDGAGFSNNGIQVTTAATGANGTSPISFTNVTKIVATYNTNKSGGKGTIEAKIGDNNKVSKDWKYTRGNGTSANYTVQWDYATPQTGKVKITCNTTTNSIYLVSVAITYSTDSPGYKVTYDANGATSGGVPTDAKSYTSGAEVTVLGNTGNLAKSGYTFGGWNTNADGTGTNYVADNTFEITANTTLYAKWNAKTISTLTKTGTPTKTTYAAGESFDPEGLTVTATYTDESEEDVTSLVTWTPNPLTMGSTSVEGAYMGKTVTVDGLTVTVAKGSVENPYTVADVIDGKATGSGKYVKGYIVGSYGSGSESNFTHSGVIASNLALADDPDESSVESTIALQLPSGTIRTNFNVQDNPQHIGVAQVVVCGSIEKYITSKGVKNPSSVTKVAEAVKVTSAGYATYVSDSKLDFTDKGIKAYIAKADGTTGVTFEQVKKVPANTGVLLYKDGGTTEAIPVLSGDAEDVTGNVFKPGTGATVASEDGSLHNYILNNVNEVVGFYKAAGKTVGTNRAYIQIDENSTPVKGFIALPGSDEETGIETMRDGENEKMSAIFDLSGRRVAKPTRGLYIVNGKKVLVK